MSNLRVGQRVKVVAPDPNFDNISFEGQRGTVKHLIHRDKDGYVCSVLLDGDDTECPFTAVEIALLDADEDNSSGSTITITVNITTYRGFHTTKVVSIDPGIGWTDRASYELQRIEREVADEMDGAS